MILLIDNYDSFTYNLYQFIGTFNNDIKVVRNDKITIEEIEDLNPESIVISPGPKSPKKICHGKQSLIEHDTDGIFEGINEPVKVARYHSLAVIEDTLPDCLQVTARTQDGEIMAMKHREYPIVGLQFHPESIYTEHGKRMIENFVNNIGNGQKCLRNGDWYEEKTDAAFLYFGRILSVCPADADCQRCRRQGRADGGDFCK